MERSETRELLSALGLRQRNNWMRFLLSQCVYHPDGSVTIPPSIVALRKKQMSLQYNALPEREKEYLRADSEKVMAALSL